MKNGLHGGSQQGMLATTILKKRSVQPSGMIKEGIEGVRIGNDNDEVPD